MKKHLVQASVIALLLAFVAQVAVARPRVAVLPFRNPPGFDANCPLGSGLAELVRKRLMDSGKVQIVGREDLDKMKGELNLAQDGFFDPSTFPAKGGFQGADYIITGKILDFGHFSKDTGIGTLGAIAGGFAHTKTTAYVRLAIEVVDLKNGKLALSQNAEAREERKGLVILAGDIQKLIGGAIKIGSSEFDNSMIGKATNKALDQILPKLTYLFNLEARVLANSPEGIVIDMGATSGLRLGQKGKAYSVAEIKNAQGSVVWQSKKQAGEVTVSELQPDGALVKPVTPFALREGDVVTFDSP